MEVIRNNFLGRSILGKKPHRFLLHPSRKAGIRERTLWNAVLRHSAKGRICKMNGSYLVGIFVLLNKIRRKLPPLHEKKPCSGGNATYASGDSKTSRCAHI